mgnify:CR=1 FL=1
MTIEELFQVTGELEAKGNIESLDEARRILFAASANFNEEESKRIMEASTRIQSEIFELMDDIEVSDDDFKDFEVVDPNKPSE